MDEDRDYIGATRNLREVKECEAPMREGTEVALSEFVPGDWFERMEEVGHWIVTRGQRALGRVLCVRVEDGKVSSLSREEEVYSVARPY